MKKLIILLISCIFSLASFAQSNPWDFEEWEDGKPTGWTTSWNTTQDTTNTTGFCCRFEPFLYDSIHRPTLIGKFVVNFNDRPRYFSFKIKTEVLYHTSTRFFLNYSVVLRYGDEDPKPCYSIASGSAFFKKYYCPEGWRQIVVPIPPPSCRSGFNPDSAILLENVEVGIGFDLFQDHAFSLNALGLAWIDGITLSSVNPQSMFSNLDYKDILISGETETIKWDGGPDTENLILSYSINDGASYQQIGIASPGSIGQLDWEITAGLLADKCRLKLTVEGTGEVLDSSNIFYIKPYLLTRLESNGEMTQYNILTDRWGFANYPEDMWPEWYYNQFDYKGIDPFTNQLYDDVQAPIFGEINPYTFVSWEAFVKAFTTDACYFDVSTGIYSPMAIANWSTDTVAWGGSCFAIAGSNALAFSKKDAFLSTYSTFPAFGTPLSVTSSEAVIDNITRIYAHCYGDPTDQNWDNPPAINQITPLQVVNELKTHFSKADVTPRSISFWHNHSSGGHSVLPYQLRQDANHENIYYIDIYDNSYPNDFEAKIQVNLEDNGGNGSWFYDNYPDWGGSTNLKLECDANAYLSQPILKKGERSDFILAGDSIRIGGNRFEDIRITDNQGKSAGYYDDQLKYDIEGSVPLIPPTGSLRKPYAYYLPGGNYSVKLDNFTSEVANAFFFYNNKALIYKRNDAGESQTDRLIFGNGLSIANPDEESKKAQIDLIIKEMDREKVFRLHPMPLEPDDSIRFESPDDNQMILYNYGSTKKYGAELNSFSSSGFERFVNDQITIEKNTSHRFIINWTDVEESVLTVYVDNEMDGSFEDTLLLNYHVTGVDDKEINSLIADLNLQVWPNPAEDKITFSYRLNSDSKISIKIFDSLGREIMTPLNPERQIQGKHNLPVNIAELPAGIYYYHFIINNYKINGKIIKL
ncbi:T9SS type A sorting domain-containing protein [Mariniphaga sp.]|uniref:T9SS type A sorting domain-containing protein n=1 Tax=Mariniphaga sp. TaxID=1954475 RepID=UPI00356157C6